TVTPAMRPLLRPPVGACGAEGDGRVATGSRSGTRPHRGSSSHAAGDLPLLASTAANPDQAWLAFPPTLPSVRFPGRAVIQVLVRTRLIVKRKIAGQPFPTVGYFLVGLKVNLL